jgi:hypothetical protein
MCKALMDITTSACCGKWRKSCQKYEQKCMHRTIAGAFLDQNPINYLNYFGLAQQCRRRLKNFESDLILGVLTHCSGIDQKS